MTVGRVTVFKSESSLAKRWELHGGKPQKSTAAQFGHGGYEVRSFSTVHELAALLDGITTNQALCTSLPRDGNESGRIVTAKQLAGGRS